MDHNSKDVGNSSKPLNMTNRSKRKLTDVDSTASDEMVNHAHQPKIRKTSENETPNNIDDDNVLDSLDAKHEGDLVECGCCYEDISFTDCVACNEGDLFCQSCVIKSSENRIGEELTDVPCLSGCGSEFSLALLENLLDPRLFAKLLKQKQISEVKAAKIGGLEDCPFCEFAAIPPLEAKVFTCLNPECGKASCRLCRKESHLPLRCEEVETDAQTKARKYVEDEMTKALIRECYQCKKPFIKTDGCNKMRCTCGALMCYICRQPVTGYEHFNGEGGSDFHKCPLYSTEKSLHLDAVKARGKAALREVKEPLVHDPTKTPMPTRSARGGRHQVNQGRVEEQARVRAERARARAERAQVRAERAQVRAERARPRAGEVQAHMLANVHYMNNVVINGVQFVGNRMFVNGRQIQLPNGMIRNVSVVNGRVIINGREIHPEDEDDE